MSVRNPKYATRVSNVCTDATIMRRNDFKRVKKESIHLTAAQQMALSQDLDEKKKQELRAIKERRTSLLVAEKEKQLHMQQLATQQEMAEHEHILRVAEAKGNEELDEVKLMNAEMMAARVRTIRDHQLLLNRRRQQDEREKDAEIARQLEEGRQRAVRIYAERERLLNEQRKMGGAVLVAQMEEKQQTLELEAKRRVREKEEMLLANQRAREEDERLLNEKKKRSADFLSDCLAANSLSLRRKQQEKEKEIEESNAMLEYQKAKAAKEDEYERKVLEAKALKEKDVAEVRKKQQRVIDTQAQEDELRARRITEENERKAREKERAELLKKQQEREIMRQDRDNAIVLKQKRIVEMAKIEKAEFNRIQEAQREAREKDRIERERKLKNQERYRIELQTDLNERREAKRMQPIVNLDEQKHLEEKNMDYMDRLERIRAMKIEQLRAEGVPEKYLADLANKKFVLK